MANHTFSFNNTNNKVSGPPTPTLGQATESVIDTLVSHDGDYNASSVNTLLSSPGAVMRGNRLQSEVNNIAFPEDLAAHAMVFHFKQSSMMKNNTRVQPTRIVQSISFPVPAQLVDSMNTQYNEGMELGALGGALSDMSSLGDFKKAGMDTIKEAYQQGQFAAQGDAASMKQNQGLATLALTNMFRKKNDGIKVGLAKFFGSVPNPHLTALFKGVGLKSHSFSWRLSPSNKTESIILKRIIHLFKRGMLPERTNQNLTLEMPDEIDIYIRGHDINHGMYEFKTAVIKNVTVNYAPDNIPSFFAGTGAPTHVDFKVDFLETTIHTREDYPADKYADVFQGANAPVIKNGGMGGEVGGAPAGTGSSGYGQTNQKFNKKVSASQNPGFGHKPSGAGAANNPFIGNNPN